MCLVADDDDDDDDVDEQLTRNAFLFRLKASQRPTEKPNWRKEQSGFFC